MLDESQVQMAKKAVEAALEHVDFETVKEHLPSRKELLDYAQVNLVLDVGANIGQYAKSLREQGYKGRMISFEPLEAEFTELQEQTEADAEWTCKNLALGAYDGVCEIHVAGNSYSSSILPMLERHLENAPESEYIGKQTVPIARLDTLRPEILQEDDRVYLKIDVQGFESEVLKGATKFLKNVVCIEMELSVVPLYKDQELFLSMIKYLQRVGFDLVWIERGFSDQTTGEVLQFDGIFIRNP